MIGGEGFGGKGVSGFGILIDVRCVKWYEEIWDIVYFVFGVNGYCIFFGRVFVVLLVVVLEEVF